MEVMERLEEAAKEWIETHKNEYTSFSLERKDTALNFTVSLEDWTTDFIVTYPDTEDGSWTVWSDDEKLQPHLDVILEYCDSKRQKTISEILDRMNLALSEALSNRKKSESEEDEDLDGDDDYYDYPEDVDINDDSGETKNKTPERDDDEDDEDNDDVRFFGGRADPTAFQRLVRDLKNMKKEAHKFGIEGSPRGDNLFVWDVKLTGFSEDTRLGKDLRRWADKVKGEPVVYLEMQFPSDYPMAPPFVRVTKPRFKFLTGHVTIGGSICMEMLTKSGWTPTNDIESILVQIRSEIMSDPNTCLDSNPDRAYEEAEARGAFERMVNRYGWNK